MKADIPACLNHTDQVFSGQFVDIVQVRPSRPHRVHGCGEREVAGAAGGARKKDRAEALLACEHPTSDFSCDGTGKSRNWHVGDVEIDQGSRSMLSGLRQP
ncbi:hypothetical protein EOA85_29865 [Mesorhizobium sp. M5C.F.Ca.IN.020.29.1.1]|uniref:hypothetical protein n=1 Tax=Mesorhizobium sp. M5C.F.Ca.IN.020.29.1.1 TaxID=2496770 RepID=UPI000FCB92F5|nr:hypothetical protein [Mesorhizobium sp. M5C.F.Ca.IN.020.29.1.1]RUV51317.1 hypothetical protein EOA85_29865 [Mesorhizobium sp. M5C.F.Ca.IN.020.29.1.1]